MKRLNICFQTPKKDICARCKRFRLNPSPTPDMAQNEKAPDKEKALNDSSLHFAVFDLDKVVTSPDTNAG